MTPVWQQRRLATTKEAGAYFKVTTRTIRQWFRSGWIPGPVKRRGQPLWDLDEMERVLSSPLSRRQPPAKTRKI